MPSRRGPMPSRLLTACVSLSVLIVVAAGVEGGARFTGPRWVPHFHPRPVVPPTPSRPPAPLATQAPGVNRSAVRLPIGTILMWTAVALAIVLAVLLIWWWRKRAPRRGGPRPIEVPSAPAVAADVGRATEPEPDAPVLRSGLEEALLQLERDGEPADAVVRAWLGLQQTAEQAGVARWPSETPTEFTSRILRRFFATTHEGGRNDAGPTGNAAITTLLRLYLRTRFGEHPVTAADVALVRQALRELVRTWGPVAVPNARAEH